MPYRISLAVLSLFFILISTTLYAQKGTLFLDSLNSKSISSTLTGENPVRKIAVYLPPGYEQSSERYPVLYLLHGVGDDFSTFTADTLKYHNIKDLMDEGIRQGNLAPMIVVMPDEKTTWFGSFYSNSSVTGNWEDFTVNELVNYIDTKYHTIKSRDHRAIAGHSMGGYGAITLSMKHPEIYNSVYAMNAALISFRGEINPSNPAVQKFIQAKNEREIIQAKSFVTMGLLSVARAFSPNPAKPPLFIDKPYQIINGKIIPNALVYKKWVAKDPVEMATKYADGLRKLKAIQFDSGIHDDSAFILENNRLLALRLKALKIPHTFEEYDGDHSNRLWGLEGRTFKHLLPFISKNIGKPTKQSIK
jgi:enterochelin esterase-like enzyme